MTQKILLLALIVIIQMVWMTNCQGGRRQFSRAQSEPNEQVMSILQNTHKAVEDKIQESVTGIHKFEDFYQVIGILNRFRQTIIKLKEQLHKVYTLQQLYVELNTNEISQDLKTLDAILHPFSSQSSSSSSSSSVKGGQNQDRDRYVSSSLFNSWKNQLELLAEVQNGQRDPVVLTRSSLDEMFRKFVDLLNEETYGLAVVLNGDMRNLTLGVGNEFLENVKKLNILIPKRATTGRGNVTIELIVEKEEEAHDQQLKGLHQTLLSKTSTLSKLVEELKAERTLSGFAQRILTYKEKIEGQVSKNYLDQLSTITENGRRRNQVEIEIDESFGEPQSPFKRDDEWMRGFEMVLDFYKDKLTLLELRENDRHQWKATPEYQRIVEERYRQKINSVNVGSYAIECRTSCIKRKDYYWCSNGSKWDYCSPQENHDYKNKPCKDECGFKGYAYKWCKVDNDSWGYCSTFDVKY